MFVRFTQLTSSFFLDVNETIDRFAVEIHTLINKLLYYINYSCWVSGRYTA